MPDSPTLAVVIPVYNEQVNILPLLEDWLPVFKATGALFRIIFIDDGSTDQGPGRLRRIQAQEDSIEVITQANAGHGPAILHGYRVALDAEWVFQIDSDHQLDPAAFRDLWDNRDRYDLLLAERVDKDASPGRRLISRISQGIVHSLFGTAVGDVNSPYRLMRAARLSEVMQKIPGKSFAPNILVTGCFILKKSRIFTTGVRPRGGAERRRRSRLNGYFLRGAIRSAIQTLLFRLRW
jgi:glycosyltransferase involved in cell wall biosynthesis